MSPWCTCHPHSPLPLDPDDALSPCPSNHAPSWTPEQLYAVVARVDEYSQFVPWCARSTVLVDRPRPEGGYLEAELEVGFQVFNERCGGAAAGG